MLTNKDLEQIQKVVEVTVSKEVKPLELKINSLDKKISVVQKDIVHIRKDMKTIVSFFDLEYLELRKRIERIEA